MSIATAIQNAQQKVKNAYTAVSNKGGTLPATQDLSNLPTAIGSIETGSTPVIQLLEITPSTSEQSIVAPSGVDGYSPVTVEAVTYTIDSNIQSGNILNGVNILGVTGSVVASNETSLSITPSTSAQSFSPSSPYTGYDSVSVSAVTSSIDNNIVAGNIKDGVTILGVTGNYTGGGSNTKYNITIDNLLGDTNSSGVLQPPVGGNLVFNGVEDIGDSALRYRFAYSGIGSVSFPDLETLSGDKSLYTAFSNSSITSVDFPELTSVTGDSACYSILNYCVGLTSFSMPKLASVACDQGFQQAFRGCSSLTSFSFPELISIIGSTNTGSTFSDAFENCTSLQSVNFPKLETISSYYGMKYAFRDCSSLSAVDFSSLKSISGTYPFSYAFQGCSSLQSITFDSLDTLGSGALYYAFYNATNISSISFPALKTTSFSSVGALNGILSNTGSSVVHTIHFPSNLEATIQGLTGYPLFGGTSGYVVLAFDLPATS